MLSYIMGLKPGFISQATSAGPSLRPQVPRSPAEAHYYNHIGVYISNSMDTSFQHGADTLCEMSARKQFQLGLKKNKQKTIIIIIIIINTNLKNVKK